LAGIWFIVSFSFFIGDCYMRCDIVQAIDAQDELMDLQDRVYTQQTTLDEKEGLLDKLTKQVFRSGISC
jgi:hypothetical protein